MEKILNLGFLFLATLFLGCQSFNHFQSGADKELGAKSIVGTKSPARLPAGGIDALEHGGTRCFLSAGRETEICKDHRGLVVSRKKAKGHVFNRSPRH